MGGGGESARGNTENGAVAIASPIGVSKLGRESARRSGDNTRSHVPTLIRRGFSNHQTIRHSLYGCRRGSGTQPRPSSGQIRYPKICIALASDSTSRAPGLFWVITEDVDAGSRASGSFLCSHAEGHSLPNRRSQPNLTNVGICRRVAW